MNANSRRLQLPIHKHGLSPREFSENCSLNCKICSLPVNCSPTYHCPDCDNDFLIHKSCAELAPEIKHPSHPAHPLILSEVRGNLRNSVPCPGCGHLIADNIRYRCQDCDVRWHVRCAAATLLPPRDEQEQGEEVIQHFAHEQPLAAFHVNVPNDIECKACQEKISGHVYGCWRCMFILHESCALLPSEMPEHPLHPQHPLTLLVSFENGFESGGCGDYAKHFAYRCDQCDLNLPVRCIVSVSSHPLDNRNGEDLGRPARHHFAHPHQLISLHATLQLPFFCELCGWERISGNFCCCSDCLFMVHESCITELSQEIMHPLHPDHPLIYRSNYDESSRSINCHLCKGLHIFTSVFDTVFYCADCNFYMHVGCAVQSLSVLRTGVAPTIRNVHIHPHPMRLSTFALDWCMVCAQDIDGVCYSCQEEECSACLHIKCAEVMGRLEHPFHPQHPLILLEKPPIESAPCYACLRPFRHSFLLRQLDDDFPRFAYCCADCELQMHANCAMQKPTLKYHRHEHELTYFEKSGPLQCNLCYENCSIDLYRCVQCNYNLHSSCMYLPPSVKHKLHIHPMVLRDRVVVDHLRLDDQYCDLCETKRNPEHGVYYCDECCCAAHIDCVIPKLKVKQQKVGEDLMLRKLDEEIASGYAKTEELKANMEEIKKKLEALTNKLEILQNKRREIMTPSMQEGAELDNE